jgi:hypothetical protein
MLSRLISILYIPLALTAAGCRSNAEDENTACKTHQNKPVVALIPVIDNTKNEAYAWNLSDEFTSSIFSCLAQGPLYLESMGKVREMGKKCKENPFGTNISWIKKAFEKEQFVIFLELVQHEEVLNQEKKLLSSPKTSSADLKLCMRIRAFDLRADEPRVILQELISDSHFIPWQFTQVNFQQTSWGDENFNFSPIGLAHWEFSKQIASRIEDYIHTAVQLK